MQNMIELIKAWFLVMELLLVEPLITVVDVEEVAIGIEGNDAECGDEDEVVRGDEDEWDRNGSEYIARVQGICIVHTVN